MSNARSFKQRLSTVSRLREREDYAAALTEVEAMLNAWPGNAHLHALWATLVQLQDNPKNDLDEVKQAIQRAVELENGTPAAAIDLGYFLDNVEDDPRGAAKVFADAAASTRRLLLEALIGQAKAFRQLDKMDEFFRCVEEIMLLSRLDAGPYRSNPSKNGHALQIQELLGELVGVRSG